MSWAVVPKVLFAISCTWNQFLVSYDASYTEATDALQTALVDAVSNLNLNFNYPLFLERERDDRRDDRRDRDRRRY